MWTRDYQPTDCEQLAKLFYNTVHNVNAKDYSSEQLDVWATGKVDLREWNRSLLKNKTVIVMEKNEIVGFGDIDRSGYLDRLFVHQDYLGKGIATRICNELESAVNVKVITTYASITAKPFFQQRGYRVIKKQEVIRQGIALTNYVMAKEI